MQNSLYPLVTKSLPDVKADILSTLAYFDLFNYPLTHTEIYLFLNKKYDHDIFEGGLRSLLNNGIVHQFGKFYTLKKDNYGTVRRVEGNKRASDLIKIARKVGRILIRFPYVRGIAISGSLSKNFADEYSDIDLFIITAKNRLWIARTLMHCFKKLTFVVKREHYFCMNYYIDEQRPEIAEKNIYTAIEIGTLIPLEGDIAFEQFYTANAWTRDFLPNKNMRISSARPLKTGFLRWLTESCLNNRAGDMIDNLLMKITAKRWQKKTVLKKLNNHGVVMAMVSGKHYSKPDPKNFQGKLLVRYEQKVAQLLKEAENVPVH